MEPWIGMLCYLVGLGVGYMIHKIHYGRVGTIRAQRDEGSEYLYLELEPGGLEKIHKRNEVTLKVDLR